MVVYQKTTPKCATTILGCKPGSSGKCSEDEIHVISGYGPRETDVGRHGTDWETLWVNQRK